MSKVHPNATTTASPATFGSAVSERPPKPFPDGIPLILTVWKKSLLFDCDGFTVFDAKGNLVFRVDNYMSGSKGEIILMDASGESLFTIRRKRLSLADHWLVFEGDAAVNPRFSVRKRVNLLNSRSLAQVSLLCPGSATTGSTSFLSPKKNLIYEIEGSYMQRRCAVYDENRRLVTEIKRKEAMGGRVAFGLDVFHLIVYEPHMDSPVAMALVILLDQMFESSTYRRFSFGPFYN